MFDQIETRAFTSRGRRSSPQIHDQQAIAWAAKTFPLTPKPLPTQQEGEDGPRK
jgi:hypothetical protein